MQKVFHFYGDPGHGWLAVKRHQLQSLGIASQITVYSYQRGDMVYLEEDGDLFVFLAALKETNIEADIRTHHTDRLSKIRGYESYVCEDSGLCKIEKVSEGRWLVRGAKNERIGEVFGGKGQFQAQTMRGTFVANGSTLYMATNILSSAHHGAAPSITGLAEVSEPEQSEVRNYTVVLSCAGNPDHGQDPSAPLYGLQPMVVKVNTLKSASEACQQYIADYDLGGGNWTGGQVKEGGKIIAQISYNGRIWRVKS